MSNRRFFATVLYLLIAFSIAVSAARADRRDQQMKLAFTEPVEVLGRVLLAGTYWLILADNPLDRNLVQIFNADRFVLCATLETVSREHMQPSDETTLTFAERPYGKPDAILTWFYFGETTKHEFIYSRKGENELSCDMRQRSSGATC